MSLTIKPELRRLSLTNPLHWIAVGFGSGLSPKAPGTMGTIAAIPFFLLLQPLSIPAYLGVLLVAFVIGVWACQSATDAIGQEDHGGLVWDEFVGLWITCIALPQGFGWILLAFVLFRFFDILKPWPINWVEKRYSGGFGVMMDDVIAGVIALAVVQLIRLFV
ncbi:phosphatidylglycerophosphatase A family protein [Budvicia aquatica]|uniref:phosphatidylglycerophosphatase A family protein n=1 Tax=Budvicia aquatica TaxID=82979 RepID=UPI0020828FF7|nr:phosphatidylglycerophosphatase A [Budvicia aquatica]GKX50294.1 phosphatidylglycerophosphatase A [Budvicia aquatica]